MAAEFKPDHKRGSEYLFFPEDIVIRPEDNGRVEPGKIDGLVFSFSTVGQLQPVSIQNEGGVPVLKSGFNRWMAAKTINEGKPRAQQMRLRCVLNRANALETTVGNIHENTFRNPTTALDDAHNIARLMDRFGKSIEEVAETYQQTSAWVKQRLKLLKLTPETQAAIGRGEVKQTAAAKLAAMSAEQQHAALNGGPKVAKEGPAKPSRKAIVETAQLVADSPAYDQKVRAFAEKWVKFLAGEIEADKL